MAETTRRLYIGGLTSPVTEAQLKQRFQAFGTVSDVEIPAAVDGMGRARGFAHLTLTGTDSSFRRCVSVYNGTKWAGMQLKIEEAKPSRLDRLEKEREAARKPAAAATQPSVPKRVRRRRKKQLVALAEDMRLVADSEAAMRPGWSRTRYDRAILATVKLRDPVTRKVYEVDTSRFKSSLTKFSSRIDVAGKSVRDLTWPSGGALEGRGGGDADGGRTTEQGRPAQLLKTKHFELPEHETKDSPMELTAGDAGIRKRKRTPESPHDVEAARAAKQITLDSISKQLAEEKRKSLALLSNLLEEVNDSAVESTAGVVSFLDDEGEHSGSVTIPGSPFREEETDTGSIEDLDLGNRGDFEGSSARGTNQGDARDSEGEPAESDGADQSEGTASQGFAAGESNADATAVANMDSDSDSSHSHSSNPGRSSPPPLDDQVDYKVNTDLRALIFNAPTASNPSREPGPVSSLFGGPAQARTKFSLTRALGLEEERTEGRDAAVDVTEAPAEAAVQPPKPSISAIEEENEAVAAGFGTRPQRMFFLHVGNPELDFRRFLPELPPDAPLFRRQESMEEIVRKWEETRHELTLDYKKRHKAALRRRRKLGLDRT